MPVPKIVCGDLVENGRAERWVRTARNECLDHIIILSEGHLRWAIG